MRIVVMTFLSLDGIYQGPGSPDEDRSDGFERGGWLVPFVDQAFEEQVNEWTATATGFLFGRRTYEAFAAVWPTITDAADQNATRLNSLPKVVVATGKSFDPSWGPVTVLGSDAATRTAALKRDGDGELQVHGSGRLARFLLTAGLVDELRLVTAPVVVGQGRKLFGETDAPLKLDVLAENRTPAGLVMSRFACTGAAAAGTYIRGETDVRPAPAQGT